MIPWLNTWLHGYTRVNNPNGMSISSAYKPRTPGIIFKARLVFKARLIFKDLRHQQINFVLKIYLHTHHHHHHHHKTFVLRLLHTSCKNTAAAASQ